LSYLNIRKCRDLPKDLLVSWHWTIISYDQNKEWTDQEEHAAVIESTVKQIIGITGEEHVPACGALHENS
jgi:hypothetical protein